MTPTQADKDRELSFSIINYLSASYRGKLAGYTLLGQLEHPSFEEEEIDILQKTTERIAEWFAGFHRGEILFCANWLSPETFEAQNALGLLSKLKPDLIQTAAGVEVYLNGQETITPEGIKWLFSVLTRSSFARDIYLRGFIMYGETFKKSEIVQNYTAMLEQAAQHNELIQKGVSILKEAEGSLAKLGEDFIVALLTGCEELPAVFRTHVHDVNLLAANYKGGISFENLDFAKDEAEAWLLAGVAPDVAGYWRAYAFNQIDTAAWLKSFILDPATAIAWRLSGFNPETALPWTSLGFPVDLAQLWHDAGYQPNKAKEQIDRGVKTPPIVDAP